MQAVYTIGKVLVTALLSVGLHLTIGWEATVIAGVGAGAWVQRHGWALGAAGTALGWAGLVCYSAFVAPAAFRVLLDTIGAFAGTIPGEALVGGTVVLGTILGALGGGIGSVLRSLFDPPLPLDRDGTVATT
jgi:hypothetical protein